MFWRVRGRPVDLSGSERWLSAPMHDAETIGDSWLVAAAAAHGGTVSETVSGGLLADMSDLDGPDFRADDLRPEIRDFYEHTLSVAHGGVDPMESGLPARGGARL